MDVAVALPDDAVHRRQAEAGALADVLGREVRLEDPRAHVGGHADAGVGHGEHHVRARLARPAGQRRLRIEHRVGGLDRQAAAAAASRRAR